MTTPKGLTRKQIEEWRFKMHRKIFSEFCGEPNESHWLTVRDGFDALCDMALRSLEASASATRTTQVVPKEPTLEMLNAGLRYMSGTYTDDLSPHECYRAMLAAAPEAKQAVLNDGPRTLRFYERQVSEFETPGTITETIEKLHADLGVAPQAAPVAQVYFPEAVTVAACAQICEQQIKAEEKHGRLQARSILTRAAAAIRAFGERAIGAAPVAQEAVAHIGLNAEHGYHCIVRLIDIGTLPLGTKLYAAPQPVASAPEERALQAAYKAGFMASGEGYNGEYPFYDHNQEPEDSADWKAVRDKDLAKVRLDMNNGAGND